MGILYPISDSTRQIRMIYNTLYQREWKSLKNIPLGRFTLYRPLVHGSIQVSLIGEKPNICQLKRAETPPFLRQNIIN